MYFDPFFHPNSFQIIPLSLSIQLHDLSLSSKHQNQTTKAQTNKWTQAMESILCWPASPEPQWGLPWSLLDTWWHCIEENRFYLSQQLSIMSSCLVRGGTCVHFLYSVLGFYLAWTCAALCTLPLSLSSHVPQPHQHCSSSKFINQSFGGKTSSFHSHKYKDKTPSLCPTHLTCRLTLSIDLVSFFPKPISSD